MQNEYFKTMNDFSTNAMDAAKALGEINSKLLEKTIALQMQATDLMVEGTVKQSKVVQETKEIKDLMSKQSSLVEEYANKFVDLAKSNIALAQEAGAEYKSWMEARVENADTAAKTIAKKAVSKAA